jgi:hypothetical protein
MKMKAAEKAKEERNKALAALREARKQKKLSENERLIVDYIIAQNDYLSFLFLELAVRRVD